MSKQISLRIPENLYDRIEKTNDKTTNLIIKALEQYFNESSNSNKEDKEEIIKILKEELQTSKKNYEDLKQIYHNYMVQMQAIRTKNDRRTKKQYYTIKNNKMVEILEII
jgi:esterase/lipase